MAINAHPLEYAVHNISRNYKNQPNVLTDICKQEKYDEKYNL